MNHLLWLGDPKLFDAALVGRKAANLSYLGLDEVPQPAQPGGGGTLIRRGRRQRHITAG